MLGNPVVAALLLITNIVLIVPGYVLYYKKRDHPMINKRLPNVVLIQVGFFFVASLIEISFFDPYWAFWYTIIPCPLYTILFCAVSTVGSLLTLTRQCVFYGMAKGSFSEQFTSGWFSSMWDRLFDVMAAVFGTEDYSKYKKREKLQRKGSQRSTAATTTANLDSSKKSAFRLTSIVVITFIIGGVASLIELVATPDYAFMNTYPDEHKANCGESGTVRYLIVM